MNGIAIEAKILLEGLSNRFDPVSRSKRIRYTGQANNSHDESLKAYNLLYRKGASEGDQIAGFKAAEQAAFQGSLSATYLISQCYLTGQGVDKDPNLALIHAKKLGINKYSYGEDDASIFVREAEKYLAMEGVDNHKAALALAQRAGSLGSAAGIAIEAQILLKGSCGKFDFNNGSIKAHEASESGHPLGKSLVASCLLHGRGIFTKDCIAGFKAAVEAASKDCIYGKYLVAHCLLLGQGTEKNPREAYIRARILSENNYHLGKFLVASCLYFGLGVENDSDLAYITAKEAVKLGSIPAKSLLAKCFLFGKGVEKNEQEAYRLVTEAAEAGDLEARQEQARLLFFGIGVHQDIEKAHDIASELLRLQPEKCSVKIFIASCLIKLGGDQHLMDAHTKLREAADSGYTYGLALLAKFYFLGIKKVSTNIEEGFKLAEQSIKAGHSDGVVLKGHALLNYQPNETDAIMAVYKKTVDYLSQPNLNHIEMRLLVARIVLENEYKGGFPDPYRRGGYSTAPKERKNDLSRAFELYKGISDLGYPEGKAHLSVLYFHGLGVDRDHKIGYDLAKAAAARGSILGAMMQAQALLYGWHHAQDLNSAQRLITEALKNFKSGKTLLSASGGLFMPNLGQEIITLKSEIERELSKRVTPAAESSQFGM